ncbi:MAG: GMC family oxidoreductase, partial [Sulfuritalea sp.]|nr:GMC family oxidoreductase [Sulfuritalea sp.]
ITLIHDRNQGEVTWKDGIKEIKYSVDDGDFEHMKKGLKTNARVLFASGARRVYIPASQRVVIENKRQVDSVIDALKNEPARYRYTSFHPQGTCRMGSNPAKSVVNTKGESHDVKNLYIADASILPTSHGYPISLTVYALSSYIADQINLAHP